MEGAIEWLNENALRSYPLMEGYSSEAFPEDLILDLQLVVPFFSPGDISPELVAYTVTDSWASFDFSYGSFYLYAGTYNVSSFSELTYPLYVRDTSGSLLVLGPALGRVTTRGPINVHIPVEPATVHYFSGAWEGVKSLSPYMGYLTSIGTYEPLLPLVEDTEPLSLNGDIELTEGYNYQVDFKNDRINLTAAFGAGIPMTCSTEFIPPEQKDCGSLVSYINGVPPDKDGIFRFTPGDNIYIFNGLSVTEDIPDTTVSPQLDRVNENTVFVGLTFLETDLCSPVQLLPTNN
jgi:hypothetical protein